MSHLEKYEEGGKKSCTLEISLRLFYIHVYVNGRKISFRRSRSFNLSNARGWAAAVNLARNNTNEFAYSTLGGVVIISCAGGLS